MSEHQAGSTLTRSGLEEAMVAVCRSAALPRPQVNAHAEGYEVDFMWPDRALIVETDGWAAHGTRRAFERDRLRDADLVAAGWRVVRITYARLKREPHAVAAQLRRLLDRPVSGAARHSRPSPRRERRPDGRRSGNPIRTSRWDDGAPGRGGRS